MACDYQWVWRRNFAAQYLLVLQRPVGVFSLLESETSGDFYKSSWGVFKRSRDFMVFFYQAEKAIV